MSGHKNLFSEDNIVRIANLTMRQVLTLSCSVEDNLGMVREVNIDLNYAGTGTPLNILAFIKASNIATGDYRDRRGRIIIHREQVRGFRANTIATTKDGDNEMTQSFPVLPSFNIGVIKQGNDWARVEMPCGQSLFFDQSQRNQRIYDVNGKLLYQPPHFQLQPS